jgi:hypothetical protein
MAEGPVTEDELQETVERRLATCGVKGVKAVNSPTVRGHRHRWCVVLSDAGEMKWAAFVLESTAGVAGVRKGSKTAALVTFEAAT